MIVNTLTYVIYVIYVEIKEFVISVKKKKLDVELH